MRGPLARYALAVVLTAVAAVLTLALSDFLAPMRFFFFWVAVLIAAVVAGRRPAALSIVLSVAAQVVLIFEPRGSIVLSAVDLLRIAMFLLFSGGISLAVGYRETAQRRAARLAAELQLSELRYRTLVTAAPLEQAVWTATPEGRIHWSDAWIEITGQSREALEGGAGLSVVHADDAARTWDRWKLAVAEGTRYEDEIRVRVKDGSWRWFTIRAVPVRSGDEIQEWVGIIAGIDERKRHEQRMEFLALASELLSSSLDYDKTLRTLARLCVPALGDWCAIHLAGEGSDYERVAVEHVDPAKVKFVEQLDRYVRPAPERNPIAQVIASGKPHLIEHVSEEMLAAVATSKEQLDAVLTLGFRSWIVAPMTAGGHTLGTLTVVHGESGRRYAAADLPFFEDLARRAATAIENARLYEAAESASRAKDEFLATLSHELRTPLTAITGWAHMLQTGHTDEQTTKLAVDTIVRSARTQAELIDDLLDLSRVVAGTLHLTVATVDLRAIVEDALVSAKPAADAKGLALSIEDSTPGALVRGDERRLRQIVWNLVANAVKFTDNGTIRIVLAIAGRNVRLEVIDTGRGIDPAFLPHVWDRFRQADSSTSRQHGGLGLGLSVVHHLVELHGGTVHVESKGAGHGAKFAVEIPLARLEVPVPRAAQLDPNRDQPLRGKKILVVDDDPDARTVIAVMLRQHGAEVVATESVAGAMQALDGTQELSAIVSDIAMPGEDGYSLAGKVRARTKDLPMIAVSAIATGVDDRERALEAGFDEFVRKPVDPRQLAEIVRATIAARNQRL